LLPLKKIQADLNQRDFDALSAIPVEENAGTWCCGDSH
jgi:hypothetical protein